MNYWVFVIRDDMFEFRKRMKTKKWPIFNNTSHRRDLAIGDEVMFYKAGREQGQSFLGIAKISTDLMPILNSKDFEINLDGIVIWKNFPSIRDHLSKLSFIKSELNWGIYLQTGVKTSTKKDFVMISNTAKKIENTKTISDSENSFLQNFNSSYSDT
mgnify:CR=1 FL=1|jgi:hypothetical protein